MQSKSEIEYIDPKHILKLTEDDVERMLEGIRERRLRAVQQYNAMLAEKAAVAEEKAREQLETQARMLEGNIARLDKALSAINSRIDKIRALRIQVGLPME